jgi:hypothetical protein
VDSSKRDDPFSLEEESDLNQKIFKNHFRGLGSDEAIDGLKSAGNLLRLKEWNL